MLAYIIPTHNRNERLGQTLHAIEALGPHAARVIVVDNASDRRPDVPAQLSSGVRVDRIDLDENAGAAARNVGADAAGDCSWLVMLDDDSHPIDGGFVEILERTPADVGAVSADIVLPHMNKREMGGLPEVWVGCGVAIRRRAFLEAGGYDASFGYYAEEYDLSAKMLLAGWRTVFEPGFRVDHHKVEGNRNIATIVSRLVRNNGWVIQRYVPEHHRDLELAEMKHRYRRMAEDHRCTGAYESALDELDRTIDSQERTPLTDELFERFCGLAAAREALSYIHAAIKFRTAMLWSPGKNAWVINRVLTELGVETVKSRGDVTIIGTMSPGPMLDALERLGSGGFAPWKRALDIAPRLRRVG